MLQACGTIKGLRARDAGKLISGDRREMRAQAHFAENFSGCGGKNNGTKVFGFGGGLNFGEKGKP